MIGIFSIFRKMTVGRLRKEHPGWEWTPEREGFGWQYVGRRGDQRVTVKGYARYVGPTEEDVVREWRVAETGDTYLAWSAKQTHITEEGVQIDRPI